MHSYVLCDAFTLLKVYKKESFQSFCETGKVSQTMAVSYVSLPLLQIISMDLKNHRGCNYVLRLNLRQPLGTEIKFMYTLLFQSSIYVIQTHTYFYTESLMHFSYDINCKSKTFKDVHFFFILVKQYTNSIFTESILCTCICTPFALVPFFIKTTLSCIFYRCLV